MSQQGMDGKRKLTAKDAITAGALGASREKAGYTQAAAAKHVHLLYEAGTSAPPFGIVCRMADLYHCSPADFRLMEYRPK